MQDHRTTNEFVISSEFAEAHFSNFKLTYLSFTQNGEKFIVINNNYQNNHFLADGSYLMFPWVGRINSENYLRNLDENLSWQFPFKESNNFPLHGLLVNQPRKIVEKTKDTIKFAFEENSTTKVIFRHFPKVLEKYTLSNSKISLELEFENSTEKILYFNFGYHPYLQLNQKSIAELKLSSKLINKICNLHSKFLIPEYDELKEVIINKADFSFEDKKIDNDYYDNLFEIENSFEKYDANMKIELISLIDNDLQKKIVISLQKSEDIATDQFIYLKFLQIYTPDERNRIALEPMSGPSNSLNFKDMKYNIAIQPSQKLYSNFAIELKDIEN